MTGCRRGSILLRLSYDTSLSPMCSCMPYCCVFVISLTCHSYLLWITNSSQGKGGQSNDSRELTNQTEW